jgi:hypothetical protein
VIFFFFVEGALRRVVVTVYRLFFFCFLASEQNVRIGFWGDKLLGFKGGKGGGVFWGGRKKAGLVTRRGRAEKAEGGEEDRGRAGTDEKKEEGLRNTNNNDEPSWGKRVGRGQRAQIWRERRRRWCGGADGRDDSESRARARLTARAAQLFCVVLSP